MDKFPKSFVTLLSVVFAASLALGVCCHQDWTGFLSHHQDKEQTTTHKASHDQKSTATNKSDCGQHKLDDFFKSADISVISYQWDHSFNISRNEEVLKEVQKVVNIDFYSSKLFNRAGPAIHLLNSVFLN